MKDVARAASALSLVLADVDGTLVTKAKQLTPRAVAAVQALQAIGIDFAIVSGRPPRAGSWRGGGAGRVRARST